MAEHRSEPYLIQMCKSLIMQEYDPITTYIPQRPPFVMVDKLISVTDTETLSELVVNDQNLLSEKGLFYESGIIENIAQTVAAGAGYRSMKNGETPTIGMIGSIKRLSIAKRPQTGNKLETSVKIITELGNAVVVEGAVKVNEEIIANCQLNIFLMKN
jgi:3-hydroxyacyl-[acyl-carrier-protein] dehydratase